MIRVSIAFFLALTAFDTAYGQSVTVLNNVGQALDIFVIEQGQLRPIYEGLFDNRKITFGVKVPFHLVLSTRRGSYSYIGPLNSNRLQQSQSVVTLTRENVVKQRSILQYVWDCRSGRWVRDSRVVTVALDPIIGNLKGLTLNGQETAGSIFQPIQLRKPQYCRN